MAVGQATHELEVGRILVAQQPAQRFDLARRPVRDVGQRALLDLAVLAISLPQQKSRWRCPIRNPINVHDSRESCRFSQVKPKNDIYLGTNSASANRFDSLSMTYAKNARQLPLRDPNQLIGAREDIGITLALVPTHLPGVEIGRRHFPAMHAFQNGPNWGRDVFIPMDHVIGGVEQVGKGWKMLMSALAAGRGISLPSLSAAGAAFTAHT